MKQLFNDSTTFVSLQVMILFPPTNIYTKQAPSPFTFWIIFSGLKSSYSK